jgi:nucleoside-diphosphate-sugar epimerase
VIIARPFNTYGPRQSARAVIPTIISQISTGAKEVKLGDLTTTRDFTFIDDMCRGLLAVASLDGSDGECFNIGSNREISMGELFRLIAEIMGSDAQIELDPFRIRPADSEVRRLCCNADKLRRVHGFHPEVSLREGLKQTANWFQNPSNLRRYKESLYNV